MAKPKKGNGVQAELKLTPDEIVRATDKLLSLDTDLPADEMLISDPPDADMLHTMKSFGCIQPIVVIEPQGKNDIYTVAEGRRRIKAARKVGHDVIPAKVYPAGWTPASVIALITNSQRSENPASDLLSILGCAGVGDTVMHSAGLESKFVSKQPVSKLYPHLVLSAETEKLISSATRMPLTTLRKRWSLLYLNARLLHGFLYGNVKASVAEAAAKLTVEEQWDLAKRLRDNGKLTHLDIKAVREAGSVKAVDELPSALFETPGAEDVDQSYVDLGLTYTRKLLTVTPEDCKPIYKLLRQLEAALQVENNKKEKVNHAATG